jgi:outer membrane lipoprotein-sorting protein
MKIPCLLIAAALVIPVSGYAQASKPCEELKSEIAKKMDANGVKSYSLDVVEKDKDAQGKVVGTCEGGTKKIVYSRTTDSDSASNPQTPAAKPSGEASKH